LKKVAVVILNYNGKKFLSKFLPLVIERTGNDAEVWVADNNSLDGSTDVLKEDFPNVKLIENPYNGGFAAGYNMALKQIKADYYVLLNSDIEVTENWINPVIELMDSDPTIAACQPKILDYHNQTQFEYAGAAGGLLINMVIHSAEEECFNCLKRTLGNTTILLKCFGPQVHVCLLGPIFIMSTVVWTVIFLPIWKKLISVGV